MNKGGISKSCVRSQELLAPHMIPGFWLTCKAIKKLLVQHANPPSISRSWNLPGDPSFRQCFDLGELINSVLDLIPQAPLASTPGFFLRRGRTLWAFILRTEVWRLLSTCAVTVYTPDVTWRAQSSSFIKSWQRDRFALREVGKEIISLSFHSTTLKINPVKVRLLGSLLKQS